MKSAVSPYPLLALESSSAKGGAALLMEVGAPLTMDLEEGLRHGRDLLSAVSRLLEDANLPPSALKAVAVSAGPGSYTGLRVGVMAAKTLAFALRLPILAVSSLEALAETVRTAAKPEPNTTIIAVQNARRDEVYLASHRVSGEAVETVLADRAVTPEEAAAYIRRDLDAGSPVILSGTGIAFHQDLLATLGQFSGIAHPGASAVARIGVRHFLQEKTADPIQLQPVYLRRDPHADWRRDSLIAGR